MKYKMCESNIPSEMPGVLAVKSNHDDEDILTLSIFNNNEDVDVLKSRLKEVTFEDNDHDNSFDSGSCNSLRSFASSDPQFKRDNDSLNNKYDITSDSLCLSTETLIDNLETSGENVLNDTSLNSQKSFDHSYSSECSSHGNVNNGVSVAMCNVTSGLLISPTSLTQDVHVEMGEDNKRMSTVLESLDLHLVYIPTTQQLVNVATKKSDSYHSLSVNGTDRKENGNSTCCVTEKVDSSPSLEDGQNQNDTGSSPVKMAKTDSSSSVQGVKVLVPGVLDDSSSVCETECLIQVQEPDQLSCDNNSEFVCNFPRINTNDSLLRTFTDASSLSSISTDFSVSAASLDEGEAHCIDTGDAGFMEISLNSRNSYERTKNPSQDSGFEDRSLKPKRKGISSFFSRNLFSRKSKDSLHSSDGEEREPGWKLFGKVPPKQVPSKDPEQIQTEFQEKQREDQQASNRAKKEEIEVMSTTALILENRPRNLPVKDREERERHQREYEAMVEAAKRKEQKELKQKKKQKQQQLRLEEQLVAAAKTWSLEIMPNWETMKNSKKARDLWWHGIPTNVRGKVWKLAFGNDLNITQELYEICVTRAADRIKQMSESPEIYGTPDSSPDLPSSNRESSVEQIKLDVSRTFPQLCIFQKGGPYHDLLHSLLGAYACYRPDVGYVQGMSFIAAVLLLNMEVADAFICFTNLLNRPCQVAFFRVDEGLMKCYFQTFLEFFKENMPTLEQHFNHQSLTPDLYLYDWIFTLFTKSLPLDVACRVWDIFCRDGEEFLFKTALGILKWHEDVLMHMDFIHLAQFLTKLPEKDSYEILFKCVDSIQMTIDKKKFSHVLAMKRDSKDNT